MSNRKQDLFVGFVLWFCITVLMIVVNKSVQEGLIWGTAITIIVAGILGFLFFFAHIYDWLGKW